jgi:RNA polymerase sigma factor (sigma-70 family)
MTESQGKVLLHHLRRLLAARADRTAPDSRLLERFVTHGDEAAFATLVHRYGPLVLGVCRRVLRQEHDAEDVFQATFLLLVRKAASIRKAASLGSWLYGVAHRLALRMRADAARRRAHEQEAARRSEEVPMADGTWGELRRVLDDELARLPEKYRAALLCCYLEGKTQEEAAAQLGWKPRTLKARLASGRALLQARLARRGITPAAALGGSCLAHDAVSAGVPAALVRATVEVGLLIKGGKAAAAGAISAKVAALVEEGLKAMFLNKLKFATAVLLTVAVAGAGAGVWAHSLLTQEPTPVPPTAPVQREVELKTQAQANELALREHLRGTTWVLAEVNSGQHTITVRSPLVFRGLSPKVVNGRLIIPHIDGITLRGLTVAPDARILADGREAKLEDLKRDMQLSLQMAADKLTITRIEALSPKPAVSYVVKAVDALARTISVTMGPEGPALTDLPLAGDARIEAEYVNVVLQGMETQISELTDLKVGMRVHLELVMDGDKIVVKCIQFSK